MINTEFSMLDQVVPDDTTLQQRPPVYQVRKIYKKWYFVTKIVLAYCEKKTLGFRGMQEKLENCVTQQPTETD